MSMFTAISYRLKYLPTCTSLKFDLKVQRLWTKYREDDKRIMSPKPATDVLSNGKTQHRGRSWEFKNELGHIVTKLIFLNKLELLEILWIQAHYKTNKITRFTQNLINWNKYPPQKHLKGSIFSFAVAQFNLPNRWILHISFTQIYAFLNWNSAKTNRKSTQI